MDFGVGNIKKWTNLESDSRFVLNLNNAAQMELMSGVGKV